MEKTKKTQSKPLITDHKSQINQVMHASKVFCQMRRSTNTHKHTLGHTREFNRNCKKERNNCNLITILDYKLWFAYYTFFAVSKILASPQIVFSSRSSNKSFARSMAQTS
mmetsp:Transcript_37834/g.62212  ORF Transcript_37834/g.62212 Transcript_37834/m.62212 type:complete len:110 (-) Transcript_37834:1700-2029(-)